MTQRTFAERISPVMELICCYPIIQSFLGLGFMGLGYYIWAHQPSWYIAYGTLMLFGWWYLGFTAWNYEVWRASGPRGVYWNPSGGWYSPWTIFVWLTFGIGISLAHRAYAWFFGCEIIARIVRLRAYNKKKYDSYLN